MHSRLSKFLSAITCLITVACLTTLPRIAVAQQATETYPSQPITLVVAFSAGGAADVIARNLAPKISELLGTSIIVENKPGANGNIAASYVAKAKADGYTLLMGFPGLASNPSLYKKLSYDPLKDLIPVKMLANAPVLLVTSPSLNVQNLSDLLALSKTKTLNYGSAGQGASGHMAGELFKMVTGVPMQHVPYKGGAPALNDLMGGQIDLIFDSVPSSAPLVQGKKIKALAIAGNARSVSLPEVPTFSEAGLNNYYSDTWFGILATKGTPEAVLVKLKKIFTQLVQDPAVQTKFTELGLVPDFGSSEDFVKFIEAESIKWSKVIETAKIQLD